MKFPKLKHTILCMVLIILPAPLLFIMAFAALTLEEHGGNPVFRIAFYPLLLGGGAYFLCNIMFIWLSDVLLFHIREWEKARSEYITAKNGLSRGEIEKNILRRCRLWKKGTQNSTVGGMRIYYKNRGSFTVFYSSYEKRVAVCSLTHLDMTLYADCVRRAKYLFKQVKRSRPFFFQTKKERKASVCSVPVVIILADSIDDEVRAAPYKNENMGSCVVDCPVGKYYFNSQREYYESGIMGKPVENFQAQLIKKLVFGGRLPAENRKAMLPYELAYEPEMSLWQFIATVRKELKEEKSDSEKESKRMYRRLQNGEVKIGEYAVYYKDGDCLFSGAYLADEEDEKSLSVIMDKFYKKKDSHTRRVRARRMREAMGKKVFHAIKKQLSLEGYRLRDDTEPEKKEREKS